MKSELMVRRMEKVYAVLGDLNLVVSPLWEGIWGDYHPLTAKLELTNNIVEVGNIGYNMYVHIKTNPASEMAYKFLTNPSTCDKE